MKKFLLIITITLLCLFCSCPYISLYSSADDGQSTDINYVYNDDRELLIEKSGVEVGDEFLDENFEKWTIYFIDNNTALAKKVKKEIMPNIKIKNSQTKISENDKKICLYMTHNDESYVPSDGYDSIYGAGGIHDVAKDLKSHLEELGINVLLDETLHIPHNSSAYTRSKLTATSLQTNYHPSGLFDIHRDGVAKSVYISQNETTPLSKIRIVVGKGNPNFEQNYAFAKEIFSVGQALYPWLFLDIYCGKGTYNQNLQDHALLFEMGTYLIEKEYVYKSMPYLANVISTVLFKTQDEDNGDIVIDEKTINDLEEDYYNRNNLTENEEISQQNTKKSQKIGIFISIIVISGIITGSSLLIVVLKTKK